ncbi:MAG: MATE family efflux transporter [Eubacteriales bacterium]|nr:MATE family efflux transporter [Eubacteriales bacterium]
MKKTYGLTEGNILGTLVRFAVPVFFALLLQALYGGVDLLVVGQFGETADVSGVSTGSMLLATVTTIVTGLSMGITILVGERIGRGEPEKAGEAIGGGICLFAVCGLVLTAVLVLAANGLAGAMHAPQEAFAQTAGYIRICGAGALFIVAYNVLGAVFRGLGDSRTPLLTVAIACVVNIVGDLVLVAGFHMGAAGAALATVAAQAISVVISFLFIRKKKLPFTLSRKDVRFRREIIFRELRLGTPVALQDFLVGISFLVIQMIVNGFGVTASAGIGVGEKLCTFLMLVPSACSQSMCAFVAQNMGAGHPERAKKALYSGVCAAFAVGVLMCLGAFFQGDRMSALFTGDAAVVAAAHSYLKAYGIDCMLTPFLFCFIGYFNGCEKTFFVMIQGIIGAFLVRIPAVYLLSKIPGATLFRIGLATPASSLVQIALCLGMFAYLQRKERSCLK